MLPEELKNWFLNNKNQEEGKDKFPYGLVIGGGIVIVLLLIAVVFFWNKSRKIKNRF